jgi:4-hydroxy-4-methyl-2-oxoglutarate aldolase
MSNTDPSAFAAFRDLDVATVYEASKQECALDPAISAVWRGAKVCGPAFTVAGHPGDNLWMHHVVQAAEPGSVIVADVAGHLAGYWGEVLAVAAQARGIAGLVIDGGLRDIEALERVRFPAFSRGVSVRRTGKHHHGRIGVPIVVGGVQVRTGDLVLGDADGVLVLPIEAAEQTAAAAVARQANEAEAFPKLRSGLSTHEVFGIAAPPESGTRRQI